MTSTKHQMQVCDEDEEDYLKVMTVSNGLGLCMVLKAAVELNLFELISKAAPQGGQLSSSEIASLLPTKNPQASTMLDRVLRFLVSQSYLTCRCINDEDGNVKRLYGLTPICKQFIPNQDGVSLAPIALLVADRIFVNTWFHLKDAILEGGIPFNREYGMHAFEYQGKDSRFNEVFNRGMFNHTTITMKRILEVYNGFEGVTKLADVGGGLGASLACIVSKYPNMKGVNFDLPHVIKDAPSHPGIEHVEGDMFISVPTADAIFMKWILHDWSDEHCLKLLKNCWRALPESGKVIVVETVIPEQPGTDLVSSFACASDIGMLSFNPGGRERTQKEFETLATTAGFAGLQLVCRAYSSWIIEIFKSFQ